MMGMNNLYTYSNNNAPNQGATTYQRQNTQTHMLRSTGCRTMFNNMGTIISTRNVNGCASCGKNRNVGAK